MIDTEVESAMRSNSGEKKKRKKLSKGRRGRGDEERRQRRKKKKPTASCAQLFFLKRKSFDSARLATPRCRRPSLGRCAARGEEGSPPPLSACERGSVTSLIPPSSGFLLLCCCFFVGQEGGLDFLFLQAGAEARP